VSIFHVFLCANFCAAPKALSDHSWRVQAGAKVVYPGLPDHPQHHVLAKLRNPEYGWGGLLTVDMGTQKTAGIFMEILQNKHAFGFMAVSLGYFDTLMSCSGASTSSELTDDEKISAGTCILTFCFLLTEHH
jgi:cystathionine beta-lyase/cystathionine gamma-synthase